MHLITKVLLCVATVILCSQGVISKKHRTNRHANVRDVAYFDDSTDFSGLRAKRIVGGKKLNTMRWPWLVLVKLHSQLYSSICGGTLLNTRWVLTAASCVYRAAQNPSWVTVKMGERFIRGHPKENIEAVMGKLFHKPAWKRYVVKADKIIMHKKFNANARTYDIALIRLNSIIPIGPEVSKRIAPVLLPGKQLVKSWPPDGAGCLILGWGCSKEGTWTASDAAQEIHLHKLPAATCGIINPKVSKYKMCAGNSTKSVGLCFGDTGGPIMCRSEDEWVQAGIVSLSSGENFRLAPFTLIKINHHIPWIIRTIDEN